MTYDYLFVHTCTARNLKFVIRWVWDYGNFLFHFRQLFQCNQGLYLFLQGKQNISRFKENQLVLDEARWVFRAAICYSFKELFSQKSWYITHDSYQSFDQIQRSWVIKIWREKFLKRIADGSTKNSSSFIQNLLIFFKSRNLCYSVDNAFRSLIRLSYICLMNT